MNEQAPALVPDPELSGEPGTWDMIRHGLLVFLFFGAAVGLAIVIGHAVGDYLLQHQNEEIPGLNLRISVTTGALAASTLLATAREAALILGTIPQHARDVGSKPAFLDLLKLFFTVLSFIVATKGFQIEKARVDGAVDIRTEPLELIAVSSIPAPEALLIFPLLFAENGVKEGDSWIAGVRPDGSRINAILDAIEPCLDRSIQPPVTPAITLEVVGYASALEFGKREALKTAAGISHSNDRNVELANYRTQQAFDAVSGAVQERQLTSSLRVDRAPDWKSIDDMMSARPVLDRIRTGSSDALETWTRRVDVKLMRAGSCTKVQILKRVGVIREPPPGAQSPGT